MFTKEVFIRGFIYKVTNNINGKVYIGKTVSSVEQRVLEHKWEANTNTKGRPFHNALIKYGIENFTYKKIEEVKNEILNERERYWIEKYHSYIGFPDARGYNATLGGDGTTKKDYSLIAKNYLKTGNMQQTAKECKCCVETVKNACNEFHIKTKIKTRGRKVQRISENNEIKTYKSIRQASEEIARIIGNNSRTVRKRITFVVNHRQNQKAYGYYWKSI